MDCFQGNYLVVPTSISDTSVLQQAKKTSDVLFHHETKGSPQSADHIFSQATLDNKYPKIAAVLAEADNELMIDMKIQALQQLFDLSRRPENITNIIQYGVFNQLICCVNHPNKEVRHYSTTCLAQMCLSRNGREVLLAWPDILNTLSTPLNDHTPSVRLNTVTVFLRFADFHDGTKCLMEGGMIKILVEKCQIEPDDQVKALSLETVSKLLRSEQGRQLAKEAELVSILTRLLDQTLTSLPKQKATKVTAQMLAYLCDCLSYYSVLNDGKEECVQANAVTSITQLLHLNFSFVRASACQALMNITNCLAGKIAAIESNVIPELLLRMTDEDENVVISALESIANVVEHPKAKESGLLTSSRTEAILRGIANGATNPNVKMSAQSALEKILWKP